MPGGGRGTVRLYVQRAALFALFLVAWHLASGTVMPTYSISKPADVAIAFWRLVSGPSLWTNLAATLQEAALGLAVGSISGIAVGITLGWFRYFSRLVDPFIVAVYGLPKLALAPLFILWFGIGLEMKVAFVAMTVFFLVLWNALGGVRAVDPELISVVRLTGAKWHQILRYVTLPSSVEWIFVGMKLAVPYAVVGALVAEMLASNRGLGYLLMAAASTFDVAQMLAVLVVLIFITTTLNFVLARVEARLLRWKA
jgi:NitT/TauT family transport system permease protein